MVSHSPYDFFDDIVCINLDISVDRKKHAEHYFKKLGIPARFFTAVKHEYGGLYGCFDSHIQILWDAYERDLDYILVFEDDFLPTDAYSEEKLGQAIEFMSTHDDWDVFHLGYSCIKDNKDGVSTIFSGIPYNDDIVQFNPFCTQALCYNKRSIRKIIESYEDFIGEVHYDMYISTYADLNNYCMIPMLFDQNFYFEHNNESTDYIEAILRGIFPLLACTKLNYRMSLWKYQWKDYDIMIYTKYFVLVFLAIILYYVKIRLHMINKNILHKIKNMYK